MVLSIMNRKTFRINQRRVLLLPPVDALPILRLVLLLILSTSYCYVCCCISSYTRQIVASTVVNGLQSELILPSKRVTPILYDFHHCLISPQQQCTIYKRGINNHPVHQQRRLSRYNHRHSRTKAMTTTTTMMMMNIRSNTHKSKFQSLSNSILLLPVLRLRGGISSRGGGNDATTNQRISHTEDSSNNSNINDNSTSNDTSSKDSSKSQLLLHEMIAEMTGTYMIVQIGTAAIMTTLFVTPGVFSLYAMAMIWSITITIAIYCTRNISGAHLNPAISIAIALIRPTPQFNCCNKLIPYMLSQHFGAILASTTNLLLYGKHILHYEVSNHIIRSSLNSIPSAKAFGEYYLNPITTLHAFLIEMFGTFLLSSVIFNLTHSKNNNNDNHYMQTIIPPIIGCTVGILICIFGPLTQAGFNPARDYGPRIVAYFAGWKVVAFGTNFISSFFVYVIGPILGAILGAFYTDRILLYEPKKPKRKMELK